MIHLEVSARSPGRNKDPHLPSSLYNWRKSVLRNMSSGSHVRPGTRPGLRFTILSKYGILIAKGEVATAVDLLHVQVHAWIPLTTEANYVIQLQGYIHRFP